MMSYRDELTETEKPIWDEASGVFEELFDVLNSRNLLRKWTIPIDRTRLKLIWENSQNYGLAFNEMHKIFDDAETLKKFLSRSGLTDKTLTYIFVSHMIGTLLVYFESVFKTSLLFFLEEEEGISRIMTLGRLLGTIKDNISDSIGSKLKELIDTELRNSLAHGTFWFIEGGKVVLANNSYLEEIKEITLTDLWMEVRRMSIISIAFIDVLGQKIDEGYFSI